jgi:1-acyl-sn-glycerol-3-phosphate acyltransferase
MRPPPLLLRRAVIDVVWLPIAAALAVLATVLALVTAPFGHRRRVPRLALMAALYLLVDAALVVSCAALWLRHPVAARRGPGWARAHEGLLRRALALLVAASRPLLGFRVQLEETPALAGMAGRPLLVLARHGGPGDSFAIAQLLLSRYQRRPVIVLKEVLRWDPGLDILLSRMPSCFLPVRAPGRNLPARVAEAAASLADTDAILIFPEGGNWTPGRHLLALDRLRARGRPAAAARAAANRHVLPPQPAGVLACLAARPDLEVVIAAHTGLDDLISPALVWRALPVTGRPMIMRWWHFAASSRPAAADRLQSWLDLQWAIVDSWIDARKARQGEHGAVDGPPPAPPPAPQAAADAAAGPG